MCPLLLKVNLVGDAKATWIDVTAEWAFPQIYKMEPSQRTESTPKMQRQKDFDEPSQHSDPIISAKGMLEVKI